MDINFSEEVGSSDEEYDPLKEELVSVFSCFCISVVKSQGRKLEEV